MSSGAWCKRVSCNDIFQNRPSSSILTDSGNKKPKFTCTFSEGVFRIFANFHIQFCKIDILFFTCILGNFINVSAYRNWRKNIAWSIFHHFDPKLLYLKKIRKKFPKNNLLFFLFFSFSRRLFLLSSPFLLLSFFSPFLIKKLTAKIWEKNLHFFLLHSIFSILPRWFLKVLVKWRLKWKIRQKSEKLTWILLSQGRSPAVVKNHVGW